MPYLLDSHHRAKQNRIRALRTREPDKLLPSEFCRLHLQTSLQLGDRGYRAQCIRCIAGALGITEQAVHNWGADLDTGCSEQSQKRLAEASWKMRLVDTVVSSPDAYDYLMQLGWEPPAVD